MTVKRSILAVTFALACIAALPSAAWAQSVITGIVRDTSGAVMPGVTVEAASPALIEGVRTGVTDTNGAYRIVDLRPGVYTLKYQLTGFNTQVREGFELAANFVATVNIDLTVGTLQESVTVSGASPVVDVQSNAKQQVLTRDVLSAVPTAGTIQGLGQLVVGVTLNVPDVGGSRAMQQTYFAVRGQGGAQTVVLVDGMMTNGLMGDGAVQAYHNESMTQEAVYQTAGGNAETLTGGVNMNLIPKDGGNQFRGGFKAFKSPSSWQGDNLTDDLRALGVSAVDKIDNFYEWNVEQGGPIVKNKLWFFGAFRKAKYDRPIANTFYTPEGLPFPAGYAACASGAVSCEQGISDEKMDNPVLRLTWQVSDRNKIAALRRSRAAPAWTRDGLVDRPAHRVGDLEHAHLRHRVAEVHVDDLLEAAARDRLLVQPRALRQPVSARHPRRAQHSGLVPERASQRHRARACCGAPRARSWATTRIAITSRARCRM